MKPKMPQPGPEPKMPDPVRVPAVTDPDVRDALRTKLQDELARRKGRDSTRLASGGNEGSYSRTTLG